MRWKLALLILLAGISSVVLLLWAGGGLAGPGGETKTYNRPALLSREELLEKASQFEGTVYVPERDAPVVDSSLRAEDLQRHGVYRIVPAGFVGELSYKDFGAVSPIEPGVRTSDPEILRDSPLFVEVPGLPEGLLLTAMDTFDGDTNTVLRQKFMTEARDRSIEVTRVRRSHEPIDIYAPATEGTSAGTVDLVTIGGHEAVVTSAPQDLGFELGHVRFWQGGVETAILGHGVPTDVILQMAEEIAAAVDGGAS